MVGALQCIGTAVTVCDYPGCMVPAHIVKSAQLAVANDDDGFSGHVRRNELPLSAICSTRATNCQLVANTPSASSVSILLSVYQPLGGVLAWESGVVGSYASMRLFTDRFIQYYLELFSQIRN